MQRIRTRLTNWLLITGGLPLFIVSLCFTIIAGSDLWRHEVRHHLEIASQISSQIETVLRHALLDMQSMHSIPLLVQRDVSIESRRAELQRLTQHRFTALSLFDEDGFVVASTSGLDLQRDYSPWFRACRDQNRIVISRPLPVPGGTSDQLDLSVFVPVPPSPDNEVRVIRAHLPFDRVGSILDGVNQRNSSRVYLLDGNGTVIDSPDRNEILLKFSDLYPAVDLATQSGAVEPGTREELLYLHHRVSPGFQLDQAELWSLVWLEDKQAFLQVMDRAFLGLAISAIFTGILTVLVGFFVGRKLSDPIEEAAAAATRVRDGDLSVRLPMSESHEMSLLASSLNEMLEHIRRQHADLEGLVRDRTSSLEASKSELEATVAQLRQAQKMEGVGVLAGGIAHDFNNLLMVISGNLALAQKRAGLIADHPLMAPAGSPQPGASAELPGPEDLVELRSCLRSAEASCERAASVVRQLLGFSRKTLLTMKREDVNALVEDLRAILSRTFDPRIQILTECASGPCRIDADTNQIQQVLMNLCTNAKDALEDRGEIVVRTERVSVTAGNGSSEGADRVPGEYIVVEVADDGPGIPDHIVTRIFEPFFTTKAPNKGSGLGLAMCQGIVRQHNGWIEHRHRQGGGTSFRVFLPAYTGEEPAAPAPESQPDSLPVVQDATVLVVDDEPAVRIIAETILKRKGFSILSAGNGKEAVDLVRARAGQIDLVILDGAMPIMSGQEAFEILDREWPDLPVLICSGNFGEESQFETRTGRRPDRMIPKPYAFDHLVREVSAAILRRRASGGLPEKRAA